MSQEIRECYAGGACRNESLYEDLIAENARLRELIGRLAPDDGIWGYIDDEDETCEWCGEYKHLDHKPDCPWLEARKVLEE